MDKCHYCNYKGEYEWFWLITNDTTDKAYATFELSDDDVEDGDVKTEVYVCAKCGAEQ